MPDIQITNIRGKTRVMDNMIIVPTYHPAYILRNPQKLEILINDLALAQKACEKMRAALSHPSATGG